MDLDMLRTANTRFLIEPIIYSNEVWKKVEVVKVKPIYWISTCGRVYNEETGYIMLGHIVDNGYVVVSFYNDYVSRNRTYCHVHRLMMLEFCPIQNPELYVVNHINGIKTCNFLWNLEWTTQKGNIEHAFRTGLRKYGEHSSNAIFTNEQVELVCKCMEDGMDIYGIAKYVFNSNVTQQIISLCHNIYSKKFWTEISCKYHIENYRKNMVFSDSQREEIKTLLMSGNPTVEQVLSDMSISYDSKEEFDRYKRAINGIRKKLN